MSQERLQRSSRQPPLLQQRPGISGKTTNNHLILIRNLFEAAIADELIEVSPVAKVKNRKHQKAPPDPFTREEMDKILAHMEEHRPHVIHDYFLFAFATGLRPSEAIALRWGDIDWNRRTVTVSRAHVRHKEKDTKTYSVRDVDLNDLAVAALTRQKAATFMKGRNADLFCSPEGEPWLSERRLREDFFHPALKACGIRLRNAYNTRHTFATSTSWPRGQSGLHRLPVGPCGHDHAVQALREVDQGGRFRR